MKIKSGVLVAALLIVGLVALSTFVMAYNSLGKGARVMNSDNVKKAIEAGDYNAFIQALKANNITAPRLINMTQDKFNSLVTVYKQSEQKSANMQARKQQIQQAIQNKDYNAWKQAMTVNISQDKFNNLVASYQKREQNLAEINATKQKIDQAIQNNDYNAWLQAITVNGKAPKIAEKITQDNFATYAKLQQVIKAKDWTTAKTLSAELGINMPAKNPGFRGFGKGTMRPSLNITGRNNKQFWHSKQII